MYTTEIHNRVRDKLCTVLDEICEEEGIFTKKIEPSQVIVYDSIIENLTELFEKIVDQNKNIRIYNDEQYEKLENEYYQHLINDFSKEDIVDILVEEVREDRKKELLEEFFGKKIIFE